MKHVVRRAQRAAGRAERIVRLAAAPLRKYGFPYRAPTVPKGVVVPASRRSSGAEYDTEWARSPLARTARSVITEGPIRLLARTLTNPEIVGTDRLDDLARRDDPPPVIFAPNHHSHLDTGLMIRSVPPAWRRDLVVAAAADYFFDKHWKSAFSALALNAIPIDREATGRKSSDMIRDLIADGYSLVIYPEGGRSPDGWGQSFKGGAAYLSSRTGAPVVPVFIDGTGAIFGKGMKKPKPGRTKVIFGHPLMAGGRREHAPLQRPHRGRRHGPRRRGADRLLDGPPTRPRRNQPVAHRPGVQRLAPPVGAVGAAQARRRRPPPPPATPLARPRLKPPICLLQTARGFI